MPKFKLAQYQDEEPELVSLQIEFGDDPDPEPDPDLDCEPAAELPAVIQPVENIWFLDFTSINIVFLEP